MYNYPDPQRVSDFLRKIADNGGILWIPNDDADKMFGTDLIQYAENQEYISLGIDRGWVQSEFLKLKKKGWHAIGRRPKFTLSYWLKTKVTFYINRGLKILHI